MKQVFAQIQDEIMAVQNEKYHLEKIILMKQHADEKFKLELEIQAKQTKIGTQESDMDKILSKFSIKKAIECVIDARLRVTSN